MENDSLEKLKELIKTKDDGTLFHREKQDLEFKKNFQFKSIQAKMTLKNGLKNTCKTLKKFISFALLNTRRCSSSFWMI